MVRKFQALLALLTSWLLALAAPTLAQTASTAPKKGANVPTLKRVPESSRIAPLELSPAQLEIADRVALGRMPCELSAHVVIRPDARGPGMFVLELGKQRFYMAPVLTSTGAIRLEDPIAGAVWLQLGNKSMLMSQKLGKRLADACVSPDQALVAQALERNPAPSLLDAHMLDKPVVMQASADRQEPPKIVASTEPAQ